MTELDSSIQIVVGPETDDDMPELRRAGRYRPPRPSAVPRKSLLSHGAGVGSQRLRRRSSARFLSIGGRRGGAAAEDAESLGKMYKQAIRMNAENRINASNSWNFNLIDNIDKFLTDLPEEEEEASSFSEHQAPANHNEEEAPREVSHTTRRVNFTKASCTLDASVKIYSYRVDDVHLTSYKVLENLHRTDGDKKKKSKDKADETGDDDEATSEANQRSKSPTATVESNLANINLNKLDAAFDIDPLFHKMSKTFDEGGAKGLLLVNLGTGGNGCNIVFDSGLAEEEEEKADDLAEATCGLVDTSSLTTKLESFLSGQSIHSLSLVPQLTGLRAEYSQLEEEGFFDDHDKVPISRTRRFAPEPEEEKEADRSIHQDALERSRASLGRATFGDEDESPLEQAEEEQEYADTGFEGFDDGDDDAFDTFMATDEHGKRFSSISFSGSVQMDSQGASTTTVMLDAIASGQVLGDSEYEFFDSQALTNVTSNAWAGSAHWKPVAHLRQAAKKAKPTTAKKTARTRTSKERIFVDLMQTPDLADIMRKPPKAKSRRANDPLQFSAAIITKYTKNESLLPPDAGIKPTVLSSLFLRPSVILKQSSSPMNGSSQHKTVGFAMDQVETFGADTWDDGSFGGDDDGPGFAMSTGDEDSDFVVEELEGVRKVDKVTVGYATIAKKVDVKRLKRDLWAEVELHLHSDDPKEETNEEDIAEMPDVSPTPTATEMPGLLSFKETVQSMEAAKTQMDVSLSFYFICILHLANEKGLRLDSNGLEDFDIYNDGTGSLF